MIVIAIVVIIFALSSAEPNNSTRCNRFCGTDKATQTQVRYPFGFSEGCEIQLNCKDNRTIYLGDFYVYNLTSESIYVNLPAKCNRPMGEIKQLFGRNYAPTSRNNFLLQNCSRPPLGCLLSETLMKRFPEDGCESERGNISCYSESDKGLKFTTYKALQNTTCSDFYTSMTDDLWETNTVDVSFQIVELEWLMEGRCGCVSEADCTLVWFPGAPPGYRCSCKNGFEGDGFVAGIGCRKGKHSGNTSKYIRMGIILPTVFGIVGVYIGWLICQKGKKLRAKEAEKYGNQDVESFIRNCEALTTQRYSYSDIEKMTGSFKETLGKGGYGTVYKGNLADDREVAVKVLDETKGGNGEEFINEVASISKTSHVNVVTLLGFCFERKKRALIYEYMPNKSLDKFICEDDSSLPTGKCLDWSTLNQITVGIARGLEYLHRGCNTRIVHFDIKPQNILLDEDFCPKISDFGLAKLCNKKESIISILGARGTAGYIAPEVFSRHFGRVSHKSDVYSCGMMVLKMAGASKKNISGFSRSGDESYFPDRIYENLENEAGIENEEEGEAARKMILVGLWCIQTIPGDRPSMSKVVEMLEGSVHSLKIPPKPLLHPIETSAEDSYISLQFSSECVAESITGQLS